MSEESFKIGDKIECVDSGSPSNNLTKGKIYEVKGFEMEDLVEVIDDRGRLRPCFEHRFKLAKKEGRIFIFRK